MLEVGGGEKVMDGVIAELKVLTRLPPLSYMLVKQVLKQLCLVIAM